MSRAVRVADADELAPGTTKRVSARVAGTDADVVLVRGHDGAVHALDDGCTHFVASLARGRVVDGCLECPAHGARFDLATGREQSGRLLPPVTVHRVDVRGDGIYLVPGG